LSAEPAPLSGVRAARTMFAALFGDLALHPPPESVDDLSEDAYSLFYARSAAMGWLTPAVEGASGGLWGMNDAEAGRGSGPQPSRVAFFQVVLTGPSPGGLLPVQPFLACAGEVMARLGALRLEAVQVLLPERAEFAEDRPAPALITQIPAPLFYAMGWFADRDPRLRAPARVTLDAGPDPSIRAAAPSIMQWVRDIDQDVFACDSFSLADDDHLVLGPPVAFFNEGPPGTMPHRVTFRGTLAEWSLDALGWLAAFLAELSSRHGIRAPLMLNADRSWAAG
jgi:hypothetical protein